VIKFRTKMLSVLLAIVMFVTFVPNSVYAAVADLISENATESTLENDSENSEESSKEVYAIGEDISKRTENAKYIRMSDGSYYVAMYNNAVHYQDENGKWQDIDNTLSNSSATDSDDFAGVATSKGKHTVKFANNSNSSKLVAIKQNNYKISFNLVGANKSKAAMITNPTEHKEDATELEKITVLNKMISSVKYADILAGVDLEYIVSGNDVKENIIVKEKAEAYVYQFDMKLNKLVAEMQADGTIALKDDKSGEVVYTIAIPYMFDANGEHSKAVTYTLEQVKNKEYRITVTADAEWINAEGRAFPVTIDPPINVSQTNMEHITVYEFDPDSLGDDSCYIWSYPDDNAYTYWRSSLPEIPEGNVLTGATLSFHFDSTSFNDTVYIGLYDINSQWDESTLTWNNQPQSNLFDYRTFTGYYNDTRITWDISKLVEKWYSGDNYGIMMRSVYDDENFELGFGDIYDVYDKPIFSVSYRSTSGVENYYTYHTQSIGRAGAGYINDYTLGVTLVRTDLSYNSEALPFTLSHVYNDAYSGGHFTSSNANINTVDFSAMGTGYGWKLSVQETIVETRLTSSECYIYNDSDGTEHYFYIEKDEYYGGMVEYIDEDGLGLTLSFDSLDSTKYILTDTQDNKKIFINGILYEIIDANGNVIRMMYNETDGKPQASGATLRSIIRQNKDASSPETLAEFTYSSNRLSKITDKYGRNTTFAYNTSGYLTGVTFADGQSVSYTYSGGKLYSAMDNESKYKIVYSLANNTSNGTNTRTIIEYANGIRGNSLVAVNVPSKKTTYTAQTVDNGNVVNEKISTTYCFDTMGRTVTAYSCDDSGKIYGANTTGYVSSDNAKQNNRISNNSIIGVVPHNLIANGGLEDAYTYKWTFSTYVSLNTSALLSHTGYSSMMFGSSGLSNVDMYAYQSFTTDEQTKYTASAYVDVSGVTFGIGGVYLKIVDSYGNTVTTGTKLNANMTSSLSDKWQRVSVTFNASANTTYYVYICMQGASGAAYVDDVLVEKSAAPSSYNLVDDLNKWDNIFFTSSKLTASQTYSETNDLNCTTIKLNNDFNKTSSYITKTIPVYKKADTTFLVSAWAWLDTSPYYTGRIAAIEATIVYSAGVGETISIPFNLKIQKERQFIQGVIVPQNRDGFIDRIEITIKLKNHIGTAYVYDLSFVEEDVRTYTYDNNGNVVATTQMNTTPISSTYNSANNVTNQTQGDQSYNYTYSDENNPHLVTSVEQDGITMSFTYNSAGALTSNKITYINASAFLESTTSYTDDKNNINVSEDMNGVRTEYGYTNGLLSSMKNEKNIVTRYEYNENNDRQEDAFIESVVSVHYEYTKGMLASIARTGMWDIVTNTQTYTFAYDDFGNTTQIKVGDYILVTYEYEANNGKLLKTTYGENGTYIENIYDDLDRVVGIKINGVTKYTYAYNGNGDLYEIKDLDNNITVCYNYDSLDRLVSSWQKIGDYVNSYSYYSYDDMGRAYKSDFCLKGTSGGTLTQTYTHTYDNEDGSLTRLDITNGSNSEYITYLYSSLKRLTNKAIFTPNTSMEYSYTYTPISGNRSSDLVNKHTLYIGFTRAFSDVYTYDELGNITKITKNGSVAAEYTYDEQGQLMTETIASKNIKYEYIYDTYGNVFYANKYNLTTGAYIGSDSYGYGSSGYGDYEGEWHDRLYTFNGEGITYDDIGNPLSYYNGSRYTFTWKNGRELATAQKGYTSVSYKYGADGLRTQKVVDGSDYNYYYSDGLLVRQTWLVHDTYYYIDFLYDESGLAYSFIYNGTQYYYVKNLQNDVIAIADEYGDIVVNYVYDAWGNILSMTGSLASTIGNINPIRYRSYYYDTETGFYYLESRYYDPAIRRFINADGYLNANGDILGFNMYAYCGNNPVMGYDPTGAFDWDTLKQFGQNCIKAAIVVTSIAVAVVSVGSAIIGTVASGGAGAVAIPSALALATECVAVATATVATIGVVSVVTAEMGSSVSNMIGENGTQTPSQTTWKGERKERLDVENPAPGQRDGQIHYHESNDAKHMYDFEKHSFSNITNRLKTLMSDKNFINGLKKAYKVLGEKWP